MVMYRKVNYLIWLCFCLTTIVQSQNIKQHPILESIPYTDHEIIVVSDKTNHTDNLAFISQIKQMFKSDNSKKLSLFLSGNFSSGFFQIGNDNIGIIDLNKNLLCNYNINDNICIDIAGPGRGPGDIGYSKDYSFKDGELIIASEDYRVSFFNCTNDDCQFNRVLRTDIMPQSVTFTKEGFALVGLDHILTSNNTHEPGDNERIINLYDKQGDVLKKIFNGYSTNNMLVKNFYHRSKIRYIESSNSLIIALSNLPYIYIYNLKNDEIIVFIIENFYLRNVNENKSNNSVLLHYDKYSIIEIMEVLEDQFIYLGVRSYNENDSPENQVRYYILDSETLESFFIGNDKYLNNDISRYPILGNKLNNIIKITDSELSVIE